MSGGGGGPLSRELLVPDHTEARAQCWGVERVPWCSQSCKGEEACVMHLGGSELSSPTLSARQVKGARPLENTSTLTARPA